MKFGKVRNEKFVNRKYDTRKGWQLKTYANAQSMFSKGNDINYSQATKNVLQS